MKKHYLLKDIFWDVRFESYKKSDLLKRLNRELQNGGFKPIKQKELNEYWFYIITNN